MLVLLAPPVTAGLSLMSRMSAQSQEFGMRGGLVRPGAQTASRVAASARLIKMAAWWKSVGDTSSGQRGHSTRRSTNQLYAATSTSARCSWSNVTACVAAPTGERGGLVLTQAVPPGSR